MTTTLKPLTEEQEHDLLAAARAWKAQGSRSHWRSDPSLRLWDMIEDIVATNTRRRCPPDRDPKVGEDIYVGTSLYLSRGRDDFQGGLCEVSRVYKSMSGGEMVTWVEVKEKGGSGLNWEQFLKGEQAKLEKEFGDKRGYPDPDDHPSANTGAL
jgi:hypothetical protein